MWLLILQGRVLLEGTRVWKTVALLYETLTWGSFMIGNCYDLIYWTACLRTLCVGLVHDSIRVVGAYRQMPPPAPPYRKHPSVCLVLPALFSMAS